MNYEILVNKENIIDENYVNDIIIPSLVPIIYDRDNDIIFRTLKIIDKKIYLEKETANAWNELKEFVISKGIVFDICSGYLSFEQQHNKYIDFLSRNGIEITNERISLPGFSEHHTGLAIDCDFYKNGDWAGICKDEFGNENDETKWIHSILHNFGFILRYPDEKQNITKMQYEPWHIRYVGKILANEIYNNGITLEEYHQKKQRVGK